MWLKIAFLWESERNLVQRQTRQKQIEWEIRQEEEILCSLYNTAINLFYANDTVSYQNVCKKASE